MEHAGLIQVKNSTADLAKQNLLPISIPVKGKWEEPILQQLKLYRSVDFDFAEVTFSKNGCR